MEGEAQTKLSDFFLLSYSSAGGLDRLQSLTRAEQAVRCLSYQREVTIWPNLVPTAQHN